MWNVATGAGARQRTVVGLVGNIATEYLDQLEIAALLCTIKYDRAYNPRQLQHRGLTCSTSPECQPLTYTYSTVTLVCTAVLYTLGEAN